MTQNAFSLSTLLIIASTAALVATSAQSQNIRQQGESKTENVVTDYTPLVAMKITETMLPTITQRSTLHSAIATSANDDAFDFDDASSEPKPNVSDPLEPYNRMMFKANSRLDKHVAKPTAQAYKTITPKPLQAGMGNFFHNLSEPWTAVNLLLQGKPKSSLKSLGRFTINTVTTLGLGDPAGSELNLVTTNEDFGQTLGMWGVPSGPYLVLPILGPSTLRDTTGRTIDRVGNPLGYVDNSALSISVTALSGLNKRAQLLTFEGIVDTNNYELVRDVFLEKRAFDIKESGSVSPQSEQVEFDEGFGD